MTFKIILSPLALEILGEIKDRRILEQIRDRIDQLSTDPDKRGKHMGKELRGLLSTRAAGQRYRILYRIGPKPCTVEIVSVGIRKEGDKDDVYERLSKLVRAGLLKL